MKSELNNYNSTVIFDAACFLYIPIKGRATHLLNVVTHILSLQLVPVTCFAVITPLNYHLSVDIKCIDIKCFNKKQGGYSVMADLCVVCTFYLKFSICLTAKSASILIHISVLFTTMLCSKIS